MKRIQIIGIWVLTIILVAGGLGYWLGSQKEPVRKILYYRNPMGLPDTSSVPKKDPMGMDYVAVYEGGEEPARKNQNQVHISTEKVQKLGVKTEHAMKRILHKTVRAVGRIEANERHLYSIAPKFEGWIEKLYVNTTGERVKQGQALFSVYSPELVSAQREYAIVKEDAPGMRALREASLLRLKNWDISEAQIQALTQSLQSKRSLIFHSPVTGIVLEKKAVQGMRFMPGEMLYQIADLSSVWVIADVFEQDIAWVKTGVKAKIKIHAYKDQPFEGTVTYIYPTLMSATRTVPIRLELNNAAGLFKPAMFAEVEIPVAVRDAVLSIPISAVLDSGIRQIVLVQLAEGRFLPRLVTLGNRSHQYVEVLTGLTEGESVVVSANFLIDAESNLKAALSGFGDEHVSRSH